MRTINEIDIIIFLIKKSMNVNLNFYLMILYHKGIFYYYYYYHLHSTFTRLIITYHDNKK